MYYLYIFNLIKMRKKNQEYRQKIRKEQLQDYFKQARSQLLLNQARLAQGVDQSQEMIDEVNRQVNHCIQAQVIHEIYFSYCSKSSKGNLRMLTEQNTFVFLQALHQNLQTYECLLLMKELIVTQFKCIFLNSRFQPKGSQTISRLFAIANKHLQEISQVDDVDRLYHLKSVATLCLDCILSLIIQSRLLGQGIYVETQIYRTISASKFWISLKIFSQNPLFLVILYLADIQQSFFTTHQFIQFAEENPSIIKSLISQIAPQKKSLSLPSLQIVNTILKNVDNRQIMVIIPIFLEKAISVYKQLQSRKEQDIQSFFKPQNFEDMMDNIVILFNNACQMVMDETLGEIMIRTQFWRFIFCTINIQTRFVKQKCYQLIEIALKNMALNNKTIEKQLQKDIFHVILQGFAGRQTCFICLRISLILIDHPADSIRSLNEFSEYIINPQFSQLLKSPNKEISGLASIVNDKLDQRIEELSLNPL